MAHLIFALLGDAPSSSVAACPSDGARCRDDAHCGDIPGPGAAAKRGGKDDGSSVARQMKQDARRNKQEQKLQPKRRPGHGLSGPAVRERVKRMAVARKLKAQARRLVVASKDMTTCAAAWDSTQLRFGDHAAVSPSAPSAAKRVRDNQWSVHGSLKLAFSRVQASLQATKRSIDARAAAVHVALAAQRDKMKEYMQTGGSSSALFLQRCYDDTPAHVDFGSLAEAIAPFAKFVLPFNLAHRLGKSLISWAEGLALGLPRSQHGVLDITAQTLELQVGGRPWVELMLLPRVMLGKTANHIFQSLESMADGLVSLDKLKQAPHGRVLCVDVADSAAPNRKQMHFTGQDLAGTKVGQ